MVTELIEKMLKGDRQSLARLITLLERETPEAPEIMKEIQPHVGRAYTIGVTGLPGAGKSTMVDKLAALLRKDGVSVGIIAVDPSSPFTGGAVLGDRIRMQQHYLDEGVFIRSMASGGRHGGLAASTREVIKLMDAFGMDFIIVETVGVGQTELDIMEESDTVIVVLIPEAGDAIQAIKAGLLEIADILVVNKADREGVNYLMNDLMAMLTSHSNRDSWQPIILATQAINNVGMRELYEAIKTHKQVLEETNKLEERRRAHRRREFVKELAERLSGKLMELSNVDRDFIAYLDKIEKGDIDTYSACMEVLSDKPLLQRWFSRLAT